MAERQKVWRGSVKYSWSDWAASSGDGAKAWPQVANMPRLVGLCMVEDGNFPVRSSSWSTKFEPTISKSRLSCLALTYWASRLTSQCGVGLNLKLTDWSWTMLVSCTCLLLSVVWLPPPGTRSPTMPPFGNELPRQ